MLFFCFKFYQVFLFTGPIFIKFATLKFLYEQNLQILYNNLDLNMLAIWFPNRL